MMSERGIVLAYTTILRWVQWYVPAFEKQWSHYRLTASLAGGYRKRAGRGVF
jgi:transposase-like protein